MQGDFTQRSSFRLKRCITNKFSFKFNLFLLIVWIKLFVIYHFGLKECLCVKVPLQGDLGVQTRIFFSKQNLNKTFLHSIDGALKKNCAFVAKKNAKQKNHLNNSSTIFSKLFFSKLSFSNPLNDSTFCNADSKFKSFCEVAKKTFC